MFYFLINLYLIPQIIHQAMKGQQIPQNNLYIYGLLCSRTIISVIHFIITNVIYLFYVESYILEVVLIMSKI